MPVHDSLHTWNMGFCLGALILLLYRVCPQPGGPQDKTKQDNCEGSIAGGSISNHRIEWE
jgi:hypothetical protein